MNEKIEAWSMDDVVDNTLELVNGFRLLRPHTWETVFAHALREHFDTIVGWKKYGVNVFTTKGRASLPHSVQAKQRRDAALHREHVVPIKVLVRGAMNAVSVDEMNMILDAYSLSIITADEHSALSHAYPHARDEMPDGWKFGDDPLERYRRAGIEMHSPTGT
ncbi:hypothetical protein RAZWK3B_16225 [Roseobacter sp. AzwK-3b]|uniref:hypothetical protein n=1 Tax=Roseobacter sp. AzwK-3b TaxID=351016 RepID=UPI00015693A5|nr:hypothetical protein [Roseobacter sp. AzwK-3b]EDM70960.1 hypothetical protein RAZWK3B_16225 [Roseobacter sp. AzwK-3b]